MTEQRNQLASLFADCWKDDALKQRFLNNPKEVLAERGLSIPDGVNVKVVENSDNSVHITLPIAPQSISLSDAELADAAGGAFGSIAGLGGTLTCGKSCQGYDCPP